MSVLEPRRILITGAGGFIGRALLQERPAETAGAEFLLLDRELPDVPSGMQALAGDFSDLATLQRALDFQPDTVFHLISLPSGAAQRDYALGRRVNLDATLDLLQGLAGQSNKPRVVYASSIAVYGPFDGTPVTSATVPRPVISYGTHKRMVELALLDFVQRGELSGMALRLPGIVARPGHSSGFGSAFMSDLLRELAAGRPYTCPVSPTATAWWMSARCVAKNLWHAAILQDSGVVQLPALWLSIAQVVEGLAQLYGPDRRELVSYAPDAHSEAIFGNYPPLHTPEAGELGFRHDGAVTKLLQAALEAE